MKQISGDVLKRGAKNALGLLALLALLFALYLAFGYMVVWSLATLGLGVPVTVWSSLAAAIVVTLVIVLTT